MGLLGKDEQLYQLEFEQRPGYLVARVSGVADSVDISVRYFSDIVQKCKAHNFKRVLIIENLQQKPSVMDVYTIASKWSEIGRGLIIAFADLHSDHLQNNIFGEHVAVNRGLSGKVFKDVKAAEAWLNRLTASEETSKKQGQTH